MLSYPDMESNNYQYVIADINAAEFGVTRDALQSELRRNNILARRYFYPGCHKMEPYRILYPDAGKHLPETELFCERVLAFPTGTQVKPVDVESICGLMKDIHKEALTN